MDDMAITTVSGNNRRLELLERLLDEMSDAPRLEEGQWQSLGVMIVDAAQTSDDESLEAAYTGLQWLFGERDVLDSPGEEQVLEKGRALGMLDLARWHLRRGVSSALPAFPREGLAARLLQAIEARPGSRNKDLMSLLDVDETQLSRLGRHLRTAAMAWSQKNGRANRWYITPRGVSCLRALGIAPPLDPDPRPRPDGELVGGRLLGGDESQILTTILVEKPEDARQALRRSDLPEPIVDRGIESLVRLGYAVQEPGDSLRVNEGRHRAIGVSVTSTAITAALTTLRASAVESRERSIDSCEPEEVVRVIGELCVDLLADSGVARSEVAGLGVTLPGHIDSRNGIVVNSSLGDTWGGFSLAEWLERETGLPTAVENDVDGLALQEQFFGDARRPEDFAVVYVAPNAEGVGGGLVAGGSLARGSHGAAGEIGHIPVVGNEAKCWCGKVGCLETAVNFNAIQTRIVRDTGVAPRTLAEAAELVERKDAAAASAFETSGEALGEGVATLLAVVDPALVIISAPTELIDVDSRTPSAKVFTEAARTSLKKHGYADLADRTQVIFRSLVGPYAACGAASALLLRRLYKSADRWPTLATPRQRREIVPSDAL